MTQIEDAWFAGLFEGEGCIAWHDARSVQIELRSTDEDVVRRVLEIAGVGTVTGPYVQNGHKPAWNWKAGSACDVAWVLDRLIPMLGLRRQARAHSALIRLWPMLANTCRQGYDMTFSKHVCIRPDWCS